MDAVSAEQTVRARVFDERTYVDLILDEHGDVVRAETSTRSREDEVQPWQGRFFDYRQFGDLRATARAEVRWKPPEGDFIYWRCEVTSMAFR